MSLSIDLSIESIKRVTALALKVVPKNSPKPILQDILIEAKATGEITATATDLEIGFVTTLAGQVHQPGQAIVSPVKLKQIADIAKCDTITIKADEKHVRISTDKSTHKLMTEDPDIFPSPHAIDGQQVYIEKQQLRNAIEKTIFAIDPDSTRYALGGVYFSLADSKFEAVATDGRRLALVTGTTSSKVIEPISTSGVVPAKALKLIQSIGFADCAISLTHNHAYFQTTDVTVWTRLVEGRFPQYQDILKDKKTERLTVKAGELNQTLKLAKVTTTDESTGVLLHLDANGFANGKAANAGDSQANFAADLSESSKPVDVTIKPDYLTAALDTIDDDQIVEIHSKDSKAAIMLIHDQFTYVVMPMTPESGKGSA